MSIFKAYDIRGLVPEELSPELAHRIGAAYATFFDAHRVVVGRDMRTHSPEIQEALIQGLLGTGCDVVDIGLASTPMLYFATAAQACDGGINVTASHNPGQYNGFKLCRQEGRPVSAASGIREIEQLAVAKGPFRQGKQGRRDKADVLSAFSEHVAGFSSGMRPLRIAVDTANGMGGHTVPVILKHFPQVEVLPLYFELDGNFPNHEANPLRAENLADLQALVRAEGVDLGIAFDGDADRCMFVEETGDILPSDLVTAVLAREFLKRAPGSAIVYDLRSSWVVAEEIQKAGGRPIRERVGHSFIKETMRQEDAVFGGELSGHYYFRDNHYCDSGEMAMVAVLSLLSGANCRFSDLFAKHRRYHATGEVNFKVTDKEALIEKVRERYAEGRMDDLDGITVAFGQPGDDHWWWFNIRPSNTEPLLRLNLEASQKALLEEKRAELLEIFGSPVPH